MRTGRARGRQRYQNSRTLPGWADEGIRPYVNLPVVTDGRAEWLLATFWS